MTPLTASNSFTSESGLALGQSPPRSTTFNVGDLIERLEELSIEVYYSSHDHGETGDTKNLSTPDADVAIEGSDVGISVSSSGGSVTEEDEPTEDEEEELFNPRLQHALGGLRRQHAGFFRVPREGEVYNPRQTTSGPVDMGGADASRDPPTTRQAVSTITPNLLLADVWNGTDPEVWRTHKVTHVLCVMPEDRIPPQARAQLDSSTDCPPPTRSVIPVEDSTTLSLSQVLPRAREFIVSALKETSDAVILVHCFAGVSRSVTCVVAHLMEFENLGYQEALNKVKDIRPQAQPNTGLERRLKSWGADLAAKREGRMDTYLKYSPKKTL